jgi:hypothetical protein
MNIRQLTADCLRNASNQAEQNYISSLEKWTRASERKSLKMEAVHDFLPTLEKTLDARRSFYHQCKVAYDIYVQGRLAEL